MEVRERNGTLSMNPQRRTLFVSDCRRIVAILPGSSRALSEWFVAASMPRLGNFALIVRLSLVCKPRQREENRRTANAVNRKS